MHHIVPIESPLPSDGGRLARTAPPGRMAHLAVAAGLALGLAACSPQASRVVGGGAGPVLAAGVRLAPGAVRADFPVVGDSTEILRDSAVDRLASAGLACAGGPACATVDLEARLLAPASTFTGLQPPLRIVELVADYRPAGAVRPASTLAYQRTIAVPGNLSTATWMRLSDALMNDLAGDFAFRAGGHGIVVRLPSWATVASDLGRATRSEAFHVAITGDGRSNDDTIGSVGDREVRLARRATDYVAEMLGDELRGAGHVLVPARDGRLVGSQLEKFWVAAVQAGGSWTTTAEVEVALEVGPPPGVKRRKAERHSCRTSETTMRQPGEPDLARVLLACLGDLARSMRNDPTWSLTASGN